MICEISTGWLCTQFALNDFWVPLPGPSDDSCPTSSSRIVLQLQHSLMKMGLSGICAWQLSSFSRLWCENPWTSIVRLSKSLKVNMLASTGRDPSISYVMALKRGPPVSCPPSHPASLQNDQITTLGWLRSRRTRSPILPTNALLFANRRFSSITTTPSRS